MILRAFKGLPTHDTILSGQSSSRLRLTSATGRRPAAPASAKPCPETGPSNPGFLNIRATTAIESTTPSRSETMNNKTLRLLHTRITAYAYFRKTTSQSARHRIDPGTCQDGSHRNPDACSVGARSPFSLYPTKPRWPRTQNKPLSTVI